MSLAVANASPLIALARVDQFSLLESLFQDVAVPNAVWTEVVVHGSGKPAADLVIEAEQQGWVRRHLVEDTFAVAALQATLGDGEAEAIVLAQELDASWVLLDDDLARVHATRLGLPVKGTAGILLAAHHAGLITDLKSILDELRTQGFQKTFFGEQADHAGPLLEGTTQSGLTPNFYPPPEDYPNRK